MDALRAANGHRGDALAEVRTRKLRGIRGPVPSVRLSGVGAGRAERLRQFDRAVRLRQRYHVPEPGSRDLAPGSLFPDFRSRQPGVSSDGKRPTTIAFHYRYGGDRVAMT